MNMSCEDIVADCLKRFASSLVVSCQPVPDGPLDHPDQVVGFALAALASGGRGLRIEGLDNLKAVRAATDAPIIGLIKRDLDTSPVRITPSTCSCTWPTCFSCSGCCSA